MVGGALVIARLASTLSYEFRRASLSGVALAMSGVVPGTAVRCDGLFTAEGFVTLLRYDEGRPVVDARTEQPDWFTRHLREALGDRRHAVLVETSLCGTPRELVAEGCQTSTSARA